MCITDALAVGSMVEWLVYIADPIPSFLRAMNDGHTAVLLWLIIPLLWINESPFAVLFWAGSLFPSGLIWLFEGRGPWRICSHAGSRACCAGRERAAPTLMPWKVALLVSVLGSSRPVQFLFSFKWDLTWADSRINKFCPTRSWSLLCLLRFD